MRPDPKKLWKMIGASAFAGVIYAVTISFFLSERNVVIALTVFGITAMTFSLAFAFYESAQAKKHKRDDSPRR